jgi:hypothetical protein
MYHNKKVSPNTIHNKERYNTNIRGKIMTIIYHIFSNKSKKDKANPYICHNKKILLKTTHNKERHNTTIRDNIKSIIHHTLSNKSKKDSANSYTHHNKKVSLNTTHNKERYNTNILSNTKPKIHHIFSNKSKKDSANPCIYHNNKILLETTHNKEKHTTNRRDNIKPIIYHNFANKTKKDSAKTCIYHNTLKTTHNKERYYTNIRGNIKSIIYHILSNKSKKDNANSYIHHIKHKTHYHKNIIRIQTHLDKNTTPSYIRKKPKKIPVFESHRPKIYKQKEKTTKKNHHHSFITTHSNKTQNNMEAKNHIPNKQTPNKSTHLLLLTCGDIERNPGPKLNLLLNHPQIHQEKHNTYFYKNTTQIKIEYEHIFETFKPYLNHTHTENTNPHLKQFCINHQQYPHNHLFYAILITLACTPTQCNQLISENSTHWTSILLNKITNNLTPISIEPHTLIKFHSENPRITKPLDSIKNEIYSFITTERPNVEALLQKFPYLPEKLAVEALKCLHSLPNFTTPNPMQNHPILQTHNTPYTNPATNILSWNCGALNTALPGL